MSDSGKDLGEKYVNFTETDKWHYSLVTIDAFVLTQESEQEEVYDYVIFW